MAISYIEAYERIRTGAGDRRILFYELENDSPRKFWPTPAKVMASNSVPSQDCRDRRIAELKSILQRTHPDKPDGDAVAFRRAMNELALLRKKCA